MVMNPMLENKKKQSASTNPRFRWAEWIPRTPPSIGPIRLGPGHFGPWCDPNVHQIRCRSCHKVPSCNSPESPPKRQVYLSKLLSRKIGSDSFFFPWRYFWFDFIVLIFLLGREMWLFSGLKETPASNLHDVMFRKFTCIMFTYYHLYNLEPPTSSSFQPLTKNKVWQKKHARMAWGWLVHDRVAFHTAFWIKTTTMINSIFPLLALLPASSRILHPRSFIVLILLL